MSPGVRSRRCLSRLPRSSPVCSCMDKTLAIGLQRTTTELLGQLLGRIPYRCPHPIRYREDVCRALYATGHSRRKSCALKHLDLAELGGPEGGSSGEDHPRDSAVGDHPVLRGPPVEFVQHAEDPSTEPPWIFGAVLGDHAGRRQSPHWQSGSGPFVVLDQAVVHLDRHVEAQVVVHDGWDFPGAPEQ